MNERKPSVLLDANAIIESHRVFAWNALAGGHRLETVEDCVTETQTGFQLRRQEQRIALKDLREKLAVENTVEDRERAELAIRIEGIALDIGEESLWAHALGREDAWLLCGPDKASMRCGVRLGFRERIISLEELLENVGHKPKIALSHNYTKKWSDDVLADFVFEERDRREHMR